MPGQAPSARSAPAVPAPAPRRAFPARVLSRAQRAVLGALMSLAVIVLERRIRKALRSEAGADRTARPG